MVFLRPPVLMAFSAFYRHNCGSREHSRAQSFHKWDKGSCQLGRPQTQVDMRNQTEGQTSKRGAE
jgi:hypothetical protein